MVVVVMEAVVMVVVVMVVTVEEVMEVEDVMVDTEVDAMVDTVDAMEVVTEGGVEEEAMEVADIEASTAAFTYAAFKMFILYFSNYQHLLAIGALIWPYLTVKHYIEHIF